MNNFQLLRTKIDTAPLLNEVLRQPELWGQCKFRTMFPGSAMRNMEDIIIRYPDRKKLEEQTTQEALETYYDNAPLVWYPPYHKLPSLVPLLRTFMDQFKACSIGRVIIAKAAPGKGFFPHADTVGEYVNATNGTRYHLVLQGMPGNMMRCGEESVSMHTGELWWFNTRVEHEGMNISCDDRIHLLADFEFYP